MQRIEVDNARESLEQYEVHLHMDCAYPPYACVCGKVIIDIFAADSHNAAAIANAIYMGEVNNITAFGQDSNGLDIYYDQSDDGWDGFAIAVMNLP